LISSTVRVGRTRRARIGGHRKPIKPSTPTPPPPHPRILLLYASFIYCVHLLIPVEPVEARSVPDVCRRAPPLALFLVPLSTPRTSLSLSASHSTKQTKEQRGMEKQAGGGILPGAGPPRDVTLSMVKNWMEAHPLVKKKYTYCWTGTCFSFWSRCRAPVGKSNLQKATMAE
jgi:hypothetical protein